MANASSRHSDDAQPYGGLMDPRRGRSPRQAVRRAATAVVAVAVVAALWELYKLLGLNWPISSDDLTMPHVPDIIGAFFEPAQRGGDPLLWFLTKAALFTLREAALGFALGSILGLLLATSMMRSKIIEQGLLPWINISQTIPLIALAPIVVTWGRTNGWGDTLSVALISTYLTFFPVAVNGLKGLQSPNPADIELMRSYASGWKDTLLKVRLPAARPFLFPAFKLAATLSVVGAIVGEISAGVRGGLGRSILDFATRYSTGPSKVYAAVIIAGLLGLVVFGMVTLAERTLVKRPQDLEPQA